MIEIGHPFSRSFQSIVDSLETSLREGVEQPGETSLTYQRSTSSYKIDGPVLGVTRVTGLRRKKFTEFVQGTHWRCASGRLYFLEPADPTNPDWYPDDNSRLTVEYTYREVPAGITDFNAGSVAGTLVRAVARELKFMYESMDQAYRRAFINIAEGVALENVVALLGIARRQKTAAAGFVTFFLKKPPTTSVVISAQTRVATAQGLIFTTTEAATIAPLLVEVRTPETNGTAVVTTANRIGAEPSVKTSAGKPVLTKPTEQGKPFGASERTITLNMSATAARELGDLMVTYHPKSVTVGVVAAEPGPDGNVGTGTITVMPTPPRGVNGGVINEQPLGGGEEAESDDALRERAKHRLEQAGNATLNAIKYSILTRVDRIEGVEVRDHAIDETIPLGEVWVRYSGGEPADVQAAIEESRAAGILVRAEAITTVFISGTTYVVPDTGFSPAAADEFQRQIVGALEKLSIGDPVYLRRLASLAYQVPGIADVAESQLVWAKLPPVETVRHERGNVTEPFVVGPSELVRPDKARLLVLALDAIFATGAWNAGQGAVGLTLQLKRADGAAVTFKSFKLDVTAVLKARLKSAPNQMPQRVCSVQGSVTFTSDGAVLQILKAQILDADGHPGFRLGADGHDPHVEFQVVAPAYSALKPGVAPVDLTGIS